ncbi:TPA: DUF4376 domain-containing protein [Escherichia coli]
MTKTYLHAGISHSDTSEEYMTALGIDADTRAAIMSQIDFEIAQDAVSAKKLRDAAVAAIKVTVSGKVFDGDEVAQGRMARAVAAAESADITTYQWKLADNSVAEVSLDELKQALALAFQAQSELWV